MRPTETGIYRVPFTSLFKLMSGNGLGSPGWSALRFSAYSCITGVWASFALSMIYPIDVQISDNMTVHD